MSGNMTDCRLYNCRNGHSIWPPPPWPLCGCEPSACGCGPRGPDATPPKTRRTAQIRIERRKRADGTIDFYGRFRVYAIDENGRELPTKIPAVLLGNSRQINERQARKQLELLVKDRPGTQDQPALALRFEDGVAKYKEQYLKNVESSTKRLYESLLKNHLLPALGKLELLELERDYDPIQQLVNRKFHDDKMAWWTVKDMHTVMCSSSSSSSLPS